MKDADTKCHPGGQNSDDSGDDDFTDDLHLLKFLFLGQGNTPRATRLPDEAHPCGVNPTIDDLTYVAYEPTIACPWPRSCNNRWF